jgi:hypothetical protein
LAIVLKKLQTMMVFFAAILFFSIAFRNNYLFIIIKNDR